MRSLTKSQQRIAAYLLGNYDEAAFLSAADMANRLEVSEASMGRRLETVVFWLLLIASPTLANAQMQYPLDVAAAGDGTVFVADRHLPGIWKIAGDQLTLLYKGSPKYRTPLNAVRYLTDFS